MTNTVTRTAEPGESSASLVDRLRCRYAKTPRDRAFFERLAHILAEDADGRLALEPARFGPERDARGIIVPAPSGEGKTTLIAHFLKNFRHVDPEDEAVFGAAEEGGCGEPTMLRLVVPSPGSMKSLGLEILQKLGYEEVSERRERWSIWRIVRHRLVLRRVRLLWLDEAQHVLTEGSRNERRDALDAIKTLMDGENPCAVILSGIEALDEVRRIDPQIERRFVFFYPRPMTGPLERRKLLTILKDFCADAGLDTPVEPALMDRLLHAVEGRFGRAIEVMIEAIVLAVRQKARRLDLQHFAESWAITAGCEPLGNVFLAKNWADIPTARAANEDDGASRATKRGRKKAS